jgi:hypothetical protein
MKVCIYLSVIVLIFISCNKDKKDDIIINDFAGNYQCIKYTVNSYYIPQIDSTLYQYDTENVEIEIFHCLNPDSITITLEQGGQVKALVLEDSTFSDFDPTGPHIGNIVTSGAFSRHDSIMMKRSGWSDEQYYHQFRYYGVKQDAR